MAAIISMFAGAGGGWLAALIVAVGGAIGLFVHSKQTSAALSAKDADVAKARQEAAEAKAATAEASTEVARTQDATAQANATAAQAGADASQERTNVENNLASKPVGDPDSGAEWLRNNGFVRPAESTGATAAGDQNSNEGR